MRAKPMRWIARGLIPLLGALALPMASVELRAQTPPASNVELPAPAEPGAIALRPAARGGQPEQWEPFGYGGQQIRIVRNVTAPTLTPVLPDPARATGVAVIVAPGGGFRMLSMDSEGYLVARWLADHGIAAFVLKYRTVPVPRDQAGFHRALAALLSTPASAMQGQPTPPDSVEDGLAAIQAVRARAAQYRIDPARVGFLGFSAGAMVAVEMGLARDASARPNFIAPIYPPLWGRDVPADAPPMFLAIALDDPLFARGGEALDLLQSWRRAGRPVEAHLYGQGGHGFGMTATQNATGLWPEELLAWLRDRRILAPAAN